ncbi:hypothetical protein [Vulcanisaeta distributa]|uniref:hypothetical protein n=1 Tax=Vulcanisaeta distributa TaxID=164451 RepID=UPI000A6B03D0|nr:hypothetical protein [Vulcanisaeta distributa]
MALNGLRICWGGVRVRGGSRRLECGEEVNDPGIIEEAMKLVNEFLDRVEKHRSMLLSDENTPFDYAIKSLSDWLQEIKAKIEDGGDENVIMLRKVMHDVGEKMLKLAEQGREGGWFSTYRRELEELIEELRSNKATIIISGEPFNEDKNFMTHLYTDHLAIDVERVAKSGSTTIEIIFTGLKGTHIAVPKQFGENKLRAMQCGLLMTDGSVDKYGYPVMVTNQLWQAIAWLMAWPGSNYMRIDGVSLNDGDLSVRWHLRAIDHRGVFEGKAWSLGKPASSVMKNSWCSYYSQCLAMAMWMLKRSLLGSQWVSRSVNCGGAT